MKLRLAFIVFFEILFLTTSDAALVTTTTHPSVTRHAKFVSSDARYPAQESGSPTTGDPVPTSIPSDDYRQTCGIADGVTFVQSQADAIALSNCTDVVGSLTIQGPGITSLAPLSNLRQVDGTLELGNLKGLTTLQGLESLRIITTGIQIHDIPLLTSVSGLVSIKKFPRIFQLTNCDQLRSLTGLPLLPAGSIQITNITITANALLADISALSIFATQRPQLGANVVIASNPALVSLQGLEGINQISRLRLVNNQRLSSIRALTSVVTWGPGPIEMMGNTVLCDLEGVNTTIIAQVSWGSLTLQKGCGGGVMTGGPGQLPPGVSLVSTKSAAVGRVTAEGWLLGMMILLIWDSCNYLHSRNLEYKQ
ncbi:hypothetical protein BC936DRAFT_140245 [Jimgerdemannia flammicorona]|uniref:Receptor L-domain domain-containing protein n=1 Tax=Jimgerdemannia flammicorona TaxID=994334 RepID=A0A433DGY5_9FUNG|nr:hypothetical protein BC936DRAFT_140245 [Jimgerdemannia flammicorona]